ncbi:MAG TPA: alpha/beta fold hydrolase [Kofleriaceae bacterium]|nr:alpha/beta fold hydrolase [Kofleriaceae bacterium]
MDYVEIGAGEPILMMHGIGLDHRYLRPWHDALADRARLIYYDMRTTGPIDHTVWLADAAALLDQLGLAKATLYGHSYGSWLALEFAARYPERVTRVIACATSPAFDYPDVVMANAQRKDPALAELLASTFAKLPESDAEFARVWRTILPLYFHGPARTEILADTHFSAHAFACGMAALQGWSVVGRVPPLPLLAITGDDDYVTPFAQARRLADGVPGARAVEIANAGHFPFVEQPQAYLTALHDFLS